MKRPELNLKTIIEQVDEFKRQRKYYAVYATILEHMLKNAVKKMGISAIVSNRAKGIPNFAEKIIRQKEYYTNPVYQLTDLCGARVIVNNMDDIHPVCNFIRDNFEIDEANSEDVLDRLGENKFGYRSVHFTVSLKPEDRKTKLLAVCKAVKPNIPEDILDKLLEHRNDKEAKEEKLAKGPKFKAEIQVRTLIQHAWAEFAHDQIYKSDFNVPETLQRDANRIAATLEASDEAVAKTSRDVASYRTYYGAYMDQGQMQNEIEKLQAIFEFDQTNIRLAGQISRLAINMENWELAQKYLEDPISDWLSSTQAENLINCSKKLKEIDSELASDELEEINKELYRMKNPIMAVLLHDYSWAGWHLNKNNGDRYFDYLRLSSLLDQKNTDIHNSIASIYMDKGDMENALKSYHTAFMLNPSGPRALAGLIFCKVMIENDLGFVKIMKSAFEQCIRTCRKRADVEVFLPEAFYYTGFFYLLSGQPYKSLNAYAKAVDLSPTGSRIQQELSFISKFDPVPKKEYDIKFEWIQAFLTAAVYAKQSLLGKSTDQQKIDLNQFGINADNAEEGLYDPSKDQVVFVAGGCDKKVAKKIQEYRSVFNTGFSRFSGVIFSGGTRDGVSGLAGDLKPSDGCSLIKIAYNPSQNPSWTQVHPEYTIKKIDSKGFTALEPIYSWIDFFSKKGRPDEVKLVGVNGGKISGFEYRMALAFGAQVGILSDSGRAAHEILRDKDWEGKKNLLDLPNDPMTLQIFITGRTHSDFLTKEQKEQLARKAHENYLEEKENREFKDPALLPWDNLPDNLKQSNLEQIEFIADKLASAGLKIRKIDKEHPTRFKGFSKDQILRMAEMEHARWNIERLKDGWRLGVKDTERKTSPYIIPWNELSDDIKKYDIDPVTDIPQFLDSVGYEIFESEKIGNNDTT